MKSYHFFGGFEKCAQQNGIGTSKVPLGNNILEKIKVPLWLFCISQPRGKPEEKTDSVLVIINDQQETFTHQLRVSDLLPEGSQRETRDVDGRAKLVPGSEYIYVTAQGECYFLNYYLSVVKRPVSHKMDEKSPYGFLGTATGQNWRPITKVSFSYAILQILLLANHSSK